jgi:hypothetical protein
MLHLFNLFGVSKKKKKTLYISSTLQGRPHLRAVALKFILSKPKKPIQLFVK